MMLAVEVRRLQSEGSAGEGLSVPAIARELGLPVSLVAEMLTWPLCGECGRPSKKPYRYKRAGAPLCGTCYMIERRWDQRYAAQRPVKRDTGRGEIPVAPLAEAMERMDLTPLDVARRLKWTVTTKNASGKSYVTFDGSRVRRSLGLRPRSDGRVQQKCDRATAARLADAIGVAPVEVGL
jgi:hypothetical protein